MKTRKLRIAVALVILVLVAIGFLVNGGIGTLSAVGWKDISLLCPLGALGTMLASKTIVPRALISLVIAIVLILLFGRAFCAWICPTPLVSKLRGIVSKKGSKKPVEGDSSECESKKCGSCASGCGHCGKEKIDSRHIVLGGSLLTALIFGFPVFCLICPIGLTFATILLIFLLFGNGDITWSVVVAPFILVLEVVVFRKWCSKICPLSALMSLVAKGNKTFKPTIDDSKCLETTRGAECEKCAQACTVGINPRHPEKGASWSECEKCRDCVDACPANAITMPFLPSKKGSQEKTEDLSQEQLP